MKYVFNSPEMHIWHHAYELPTDRQYGVNFGLSLAIWDYLWRTAYIPFNGRDIRLGFLDVRTFSPKVYRPESFMALKKKREI